jgi:hypothetical protein
VDAGRKSLLDRDLLKELAELFAFGSGQRGAQRFYVLATDAAYLAEHPLAFLGQMQCILSAIITIWPAFDQPSFFERVEYRYQTTGMDAESRRQLLLTEPARGAQHAQDPGVRRCEIEVGDPLAKSHGRMRAYLGQQEGQWGFCPLHEYMIAFINRLVYKRLYYGTNFSNTICRASTLAACHCLHAAVRGQHRFCGFAAPWPAVRYPLRGCRGGTRLLCRKPVRRLRYLGVRAAGTNIALFGGFAASGAIAISGLCTWVLSVSEVSSSLVATRALYFMSFLFGGAGFAVAFGLLAAGVSVTSHFARLLPLWLVVLGMIAAVAGELSSLSLIAYPANLAIPITRFAGFAWLILVGARLPKTLGRTEGVSPEGATASALYEIRSRW